MKFCALQTLVTTAFPLPSNTCISTFAFVRPAVPVSLTENEMLVVLPGSTQAGVAVAEDVNVSDEFTAMAPAELFQDHCCQVALNTPVRTVNVPAIAGVNESV